jgi:preprotein translocase subunit SecE
MSKVKIVSIIYAIDIIIGALFFDVWGVETTPLKTLSVFAWTVIFIIALFFIDKSERN